jgi:hypothetical protein
MYNSAFKHGVNHFLQVIKGNMQEFGLQPTRTYGDFLVFESKGIFILQNLYNEQQTNL